MSFRCASEQSTAGGLNSDVWEHVMWVAYGDRASPVSVASLALVCRAGRDAMRSYINIASVSRLSRPTSSAVSLTRTFLECSHAGGFHGGGSSDSPLFPCESSPSTSRGCFVPLGPLLGGPPSIDGNRLIPSGLAASFLRLGFQCARGTSSGDSGIRAAATARLISRMGIRFQWPGLTVDVLFCKPHVSSRRVIRCGNDRIVVFCNLVEAAKLRDSASRSIGKTEHMRIEDLAAEYGMANHMHEMRTSRRKCAETSHVFSSHEPIAVSSTCTPFSTRVSFIGIGWNSGAGAFEFYPRDISKLDQVILLCDVDHFVAVDTSLDGRPVMLCHAMPFGIHGPHGIFDNNLASEASHQDDIETNEMARIIRGMAAFSSEDPALMLLTAPIVTLAMETLPDGRTWVSAFNMLSSKHWSHKLSCYARFLLRHVLSVLS